MAFCECPADESLTKFLLNSTSVYNYSVASLHRCPTESSNSAYPQYSLLHFPQTSVSVSEFLLVNDRIVFYVGPTIDLEVLPNASWCMYSEVKQTWIQILSYQQLCNLNQGI